MRSSRHRIPEPISKTIAKLIVLKKKWFTRHTGTRTSTKNQAKKKEPIFASTFSRYGYELRYNRENNRIYGFRIHSNDGDYSSCYAYEMEWTLTASLSAALLANKGLIHEVPQKSSQNSSSWMLSCVEEERMIDRSDDFRCNRQFEVAVNEIDRKQSQNEESNSWHTTYPYAISSWIKGQQHFLGCRRLFFSLWKIPQNNVIVTSSPLYNFEDGREYHTRRNRMWRRKGRCLVEDIAP